MFLKILLVVTFFTLSNGYATVCPDLEGVYQCGLDGAIEFPIEISQRQDDAGIITYDLYGESFPTDGVKRAVPGIDDNFVGTYSAVCKTDELKLSLEGSYSAMQNLIVVPIQVGIDFRPATKDGVDIIQGRLSLEFQGRYSMAQKEFFNGLVEINLSEDGTSFVCTKQ